MKELDNEFFNRADEHIHLSNKQATKINIGKVSASMLYSTARFNAYVKATEFKSAEELKEAKQNTIDYFLNEYAKMLDENLEDYINNFEEYMKS